MRTRRSRSKVVWWVVFLAFLALAAWFALCSLPSGIQRSSRDLAAAHTVKYLGLAMVKYQLCCGEVPQDVDDLLNCGLVRPRLVGQDWCVDGGLTNRLPRDLAEDARFCIPSATNGLRWDGTTLVDEHGRELPPLVELSGHPQGRRVVRAQRYVAQVWYRVRESIPLEDAWLEAWLSDCDSLDCRSSE